MYTATSLEDIAVMLEILADRVADTPTLSRREKDKQWGILFGYRDAAATLRKTNLVPAKPEGNVYDYFVKHLGDDADLLIDVTLKELPVDSTCGADCAAAINAAVAVIKHTKAAFGDDEEDHVYEVRRKALEVVECYWRG